MSARTPALIFRSAAASGHVAPALARSEPEQVGHDVGEREQVSHVVGEPELGHGKVMWRIGERE
jgi:hypothetical protein